MNGHVTQVSVWAVPDLRTPVIQAFLLTQAAALSKKSQGDSKAGDCAYSSSVLSTKRSYASIFLKQIFLLIIFCLLSTGWVLFYFPL